MDINKMMTNEIFTTNDKTHSQNMNSTQYRIMQSWIEPFRVFDKPKCFSHNSLYYRYLTERKFYDPFLIHQMKWRVQWIEKLCLREFKNGIQ